MHLIFDTETTGLPRSWKAPISDGQNWPRMVQLAYQLYDDAQNLVKEVNHIIRPDGYIIPDNVAEIHGITTERALAEGIALQDALDEFFIDADRALHLIAHNSDFDAKIIDAEFLRLNQSPLLTTTQLVCTMKGSAHVCKIKGPYGYKWPKLEQLHMHLFKESFDGAHNALIDVQATARCYFKLRELNYL